MLLYWNTKKWPGLLSTGRRNKHWKC